MSQADVVYSCSSCGYPLNLSSDRVISDIDSKYQKSIKKGVISFSSVDLSRFTQVDEVNCIPISLGPYRSKTKLLCRKCGALLGHGYRASTVLCGCEPPSSSASTCRKYRMKIRALQPSEQSFRALQPSEQS
ncbi:uncharacterized protein M6B38_410245 [Iris pallida]|uniref:Protein yippee-like n=1 Tax=Iris pallida TaxID=29817 RepID=A0AAX6FMM2_IRIPA|nr:uncharacterized protein M6B38_410245 [Iris pallida]